jgi:hypothetical protein
MIKLYVLTIVIITSLAGIFYQIHKYNQETIWIKNEIMCTNGFLHKVEHYKHKQISYPICEDMAFHGCIKYIKCEN